MLVLTTMCKLMLALAIGFYLFRSGVFTKETNRTMSAFISKITNPCLIIYSLSTISNASAGSVMKLFLGGTFTYVLYFLFGILFCRVFRIRKGVRGMYICMIMFANYGFMGYPVVESLFGASAIFYLSIFNMAFNFLIYTLGMYLIVHDASESGAENATFHFDIRNLMTAGVFASVLSLVVFFSGIKIPSMIYECAGFIGNVTMPLAMIVIGSNMAASSLKDVRSEKGILPLTIVRLAVLPVMIWGFMHLITDDPNLIRICTVGAGMPVGALTSMLSAPWPEQNRSVSICVAFTTLVSLITLPVLILLLGV